MKRAMLLFTLAALLLLANGVLATSVQDYRLDWLTLAGGGGGPAGSSGSAVNLTAGQTVVGAASGAEYQACLGYWCGGSFYQIYPVYLPLVVN
jgi:hypothetical protein